MSKAKEFIRLHVQERITVGDVATALNISRRTLEKRFLEISDHGVADEIRTERLKRVRRLLVETNRTISDIALDSGFASPTHLAGLFKRSFGLTLGECRKQPDSTSSEGSFRANRPPAMPPNAVCVARGKCPEDASRADVPPAQG